MEEVDEIAEEEITAGSTIVSPEQTPGKENQAKPQTAGKGPPVSEGGCWIEDTDREFKQR